MRTINSPEYARNYGFWNEAEQQAIMDTHVAIAGVGGDGHQLGLKLAQMGVAEFSVADPEVFEPENTNRVPGATQTTYGKNKAEVFRDKVLDINPDAKVHVFTDGVQQDNIEDFMHGATLSFDESELTMPEIGTMVAREARKRHIPNVLVMNVGFAALATSFHPEKGKTFEDIMGIPNDMPLDEVSEVEVDLSRCLPYVPRYGDLNTLIAAQDGAPLPSISVGVDIAAGLGSTQALKHIFSQAGNNRSKPVWAPKFAYMDAYDLSVGVTRFPRLSHKRHAVQMLVRSYLGVNPKASYTEEDRTRRMKAFANQE